MRGSEFFLTGPSPTSSLITTSMTSHATMPARKHPVDDEPSLPREPCMCRIGFPSSSGNTFPVPVSSQ